MPQHEPKVAPSDPSHDHNYHHTNSHVRGHRSAAMRLAEDDARARLAAHDHGILCTVHPERGVDAVPVAYAVDDDGYVGVPIDRVKPKGSSPAASATKSII